jgi:hypothetical protein
MKFKNEKQKEFILTLIVKVGQVVIAMLAGAGAHDCMSQLN